MHREFRQLLHAATGENKFVIVANLDIRAFSEWSRSVESQEAMLYLAKIIATSLTCFSIGSSSPPGMDSSSYSRSRNPILKSMWLRPSAAV